MGPRTLMDHAVVLGRAAAVVWAVGATLALGQAFGVLPGRWS